MWMCPVRVRYCLGTKSRHSLIDNTYYMSKWLDDDYKLCILWWVTHQVIINFVAAVVDCASGRHSTMIWNNGKFVSSSPFLSSASPSASLSRCEIHRKRNLTSSSSLAKWLRPARQCTTHTWRKSRQIIPNNCLWWWVEYNVFVEIIFMCEKSYFLFLRVN